MALTTKLIQQHFDGFRQTPSLWKNNFVFELQQFEINEKSLPFNLEIDTNLRLGKYIERFVSFQLQQEKSIKLLAENIQIRRNKITLGEIDCLLVRDNRTIHLEIIYKFYLYDDLVGNTEIEHFIGPNRKDSLIKKLNKLKEKQLPLLYSNECKTYLKSLNLSVEDIKQEVCFKAQLFVPLNEKSMRLAVLNQDCIKGFYIKKEELQQFTTCKFYIPSKKDWLITPNAHVDWMGYTLFRSKINNYLAREFSQLVWLKHASGDIDKLFVVWW